ncbi:hypothetical protein D0544_13030 [Aestuariirhabdus litorea]|uniref:3-hydroxylacyl-ACP dehydratase n=2 Tax=Aestuariirhabdus litorea TaxID=2528527 RepID=A0A3P3VPM9_9GAMM|nr:hypothetical protein [Aestuariirhabdus litorea]RRJ82773.1 hypothetical protein D0544_13030 [Aestuariirhabdus litorea]RWW92933.1 hypothetical protein DZC74_13005 [Endozoicomonadaceae bacterium GTF-13]
MVERLLSIDETRARCALTLRADNPFIGRQGTLPGYLGIELMAQGVALFAGYHCLRRGEPVRVGYLLGSRHYRSHRSHLEPGCELEIEVEQEYFSEGMALFSCRLLAQGNELASARLNTFQAPLANV